MNYYALSKFIIQFAKSEEKKEKYFYATPLQGRLIFI